MARKMVVDPHENGWELWDNKNYGAHCASSGSPCDSSAALASLFEHAEEKRSKLRCHKKETSSHRIWNLPAISPCAETKDTHNPHQAQRTTNPQGLKTGNPIYPFVHRPGNSYVVIEGSVSIWL